MISKDKIQEVVSRLVETYDPLEIYLFGSYAWGNPTEDSDLDLLIVVDHSNQKRRKRVSSGYLALFGLQISKDIIVYTKDEFDERIANETSLGYKIKHDGKRIYAKA